MGSALCALGVWSGLSDAVQLPDGRGYELVSPPKKNGGDVVAVTARLRSAVDGSAAAYASLSAADDALGTGVASEYESMRTAEPGTQGWSTHAITPPQPPLTYALLLFGFDPGYQGEFSPDLNRGVVRVRSPLTDAPNVARADNLYLRDDLRTPGPGNYRLVTDCPACTVPLSDLSLFQYGLPLLSDTSTDLRHILFISRAPLATDAAAGWNAYEWDNGTVRLAGVLPDGTSAPGSIAGGDFPETFGTFLFERSMSDDGRKVFFSAPADVNSANLYMRVDGSSTVQLNASETATPSSGPARFWDASNDGSRVFFTTADALTADAVADGDSKLYMYDTTKPADDPHNLTLLNVDNESGDTSNNVPVVVGASDDGSTVYFIDTGQLVAGRPLVSFGGLFAWHDGVVSYVSALAPGDQAELSGESSGLKQARVAGDGDVVFSTVAHVGPTGYDQGSCGGGFGCREFYLYRIGTHRLSCVSCNPSGAAATADATILVRQGDSAAQRVIRQTRAATDDGAHAFFNTAESLVPEDRNHEIDAYEYDAASDSVHLISSGRDRSPSYFVNVTPGGHDVFFVTREQLIGWDRDGNYDLYDARVGGGFPDPSAAASQCSGDPCQGLPASPPDAPGSSSSLSAGRGNEQGVLHRHTRRRCRRGHVKRRVHGHVRCVRRGHRAARHQAAGVARGESQRRSR